MASSYIDIVNSALYKIGEDAIESFGAGTPQADAASNRYDHCRRAVADMHGWKCLRTRITLTADATDPDHTYAKQVSLPADFIRALPEGGLEQLEAYEWVQEGNKILLNGLTTLKLVYIKDETDVSKFSPLFEEAVALYLAADICLFITGSRERASELKVEFERFLLMAKSRDSLRGGRRQIRARSLHNAHAGGRILP